MSTKFKQPGLVDKLTCLVLGHKYLYDGAILDRKTPTLTNFIYKEDDENVTAVGLCFCPRCYTFIGIHFTEKKEPKPEITESIEPTTKKTKAKAKPAIKKFKK